MGIRDDRYPMDRAIALQKAPAEGAASLARRRYV